MQWLLDNASRLIHDAIFKDKSQALCSRAWDNRSHSFWSVWVRIFGARHCEKSWRHYHIKE